MKKLLAILFLLCCVSAQAVDRITATITITNTPANNDTFTVNGDVRTWKTTVTIPATQISVTNVVGYAATNLFNQAAAYLYSGPLNLSYSGTNGIKLIANSGNALVVSASGTWATVTMSTQTVTSLTMVRTPISGEPTASVRTNISSDLVQAISDYSTTAVATASVALSNFVNRTAAQTISGDKTFTGANIYSNSAQAFYGGTWTDGTLTNGANYGQPFRSPGSGSASEQFGTSAAATGDGSLAVGSAATASEANTVALGTSAAASGGKAIAIGNSSISQGLGSIAIGDAAESGVDGAIAIGKDALSAFENSTSIGPNAQSTAEFQFRLGTPLYSVSIPGGLQVDGSISNATFAGSVTLNNELIVTSFANGSLANGNNAAMSISTNAYVTIASGPSATFTICGIAGGVAGRVVTLENTTGQSMVIAEQSGVDPTAGNRIKTGLSADYTSTNNPGVISFRYNGTLSRWVLISHN